MSNVTPMRKDTAKETWLSPEQVCDIAPGMTVGILDGRRKQGLKPDFFKPTGAGGRGAVVYAESEVHAWVRGSRVTTREST